MPTPAGAPAYLLHFNVVSCSCRPVAGALRLPLGFRSRTRSFCPFDLVFGPAVSFQGSGRCGLDHQHVGLWYADALRRVARPGRRSIAGHALVLLAFPRAVRRASIPPRSCISSRDPRGRGPIAASIGLDTSSGMVLLAWAARFQMRASAGLCGRRSATRRGRPKRTTSEDGSVYATHAEPIRMGQ